MSQAIEDVMIRYNQFSEHVSELRAIGEIALTNKELNEAAKNGDLVARQRLKMEDGTVVGIGDSVLIPAEHAFCNPTMVTTKQRQATTTEYTFAKSHLDIVNPLANHVQQARRVVGDTESLVNTLPVPIKSVNASLQQQREQQETAEAALSAALNNFYGA